MIDWEIQNDWNVMSPREKIVRVLEIAFSEAALLVYAAFILYFAGGLSLRATLAIMTVFSLFWYWHQRCLKYIESVHRLTSKPYILSVRFNLDKMLSELNLTPNEVEMPKLHSDRYGIWAVVLKSGQGSELLVHWLNRNAYSTKLDYVQELDFVKLPYVTPNILFDSWSPAFFFTQGVIPKLYETKNREDRAACVGYEIGISVANDWWDENKDKLQSAQFKGIEQNGMTKITFALLPSVAFSLIDCKRLKEKEMTEIRDYAGKVVSAAGWTAKYGWNQYSGSREGISPGGESQFVCEYANVDLILL